MAYVVFSFFFYPLGGFSDIKSNIQRDSERDLEDKSTQCMCVGGCIKTDCIWVLLESLFCHSTFHICHHVSPSSFTPSSPRSSHEASMKIRYYVVCVTAVVTADWRKQGIREGRWEMGCWHHVSPDRREEGNGKGPVEVFYKLAAA